MGIETVDMSETTGTDRMDMSQTTWPETVDMYDTKHISEKTGV